MFSGIGALPEPATGSHVVNRGTPVAPCRLKAQRKRVTRVGSPCSPGFPNIMSCQSINLLLFLQKQNLATAIYLFGLGTLLTGLGLKHMRICSHHDLVGALVTSLFLGRPWWSTTSPTCLPLSVFTITSDQHRCRIPPLL